MNQASRAGSALFIDPQQAPDGPRGDDLTTTAVPLIAELAANAALHGRVRGREARLDVHLHSTKLRIEVIDARGDRWPPTHHHPADDGESGRGLLLVEALSDDWGVRPHHPGAKTVWVVCRR
ncbi:MULTISPECIES: ATP-binding protein [Streptomyces]|uniref:ATP-binding protein n=1 Tax=Streptomyces TaxID=1883 RepID=UPI000B83FA32|nr:MULTISPECIES: ATP-binding protein [Streptomyces]MYW82388.1 ATP-binding protein [Streptomyces sp. SID8369]